MTDEFDISLDFAPFPKIPRLRNECMLITEKIDGTNAQIVIHPDGRIRCGSRNRWISVDDDNYGFARWVEDHKAEILTLGHGRHYGEWWGQGIQRGYGQPCKRFSLFNVMRPIEAVPACVSLVPILYKGGLDSTQVDLAMARLKSEGSLAAPGCMHPEGIVIKYLSTKATYKKLCENDEIRKSEVAA